MSPATEAKGRAVGNTTNMRVGLSSRSVTQHHRLSRAAVEDLVRGRHERHSAASDPGDLLTETATGA